MLVWNPEGVDDELWERLRGHFSDDEIVELGSFVCTTFGQQRVIKTWQVGHGEYVQMRLGSTPDEVRARVPAALASWEFMRDRVLQGGIADPELKRLCFRFLAQDDDVMDVGRFTPRQQAALRWAQAIAWDANLAGDELWAALHREFSEPELVELGCAIGFALGQQHWERTLGFAPHAGLS